MGVETTDANQISIGAGTQRETGGFCINESKSLHLKIGCRGMT